MCGKGGRGQQVRVWSVLYFWSSVKKDLVFKTARNRDYEASLGCCCLQFKQVEGRPVLSATSLCCQYELLYGLGFVFIFYFSVSK